ncbi:MAG TPA: type II toxin-antitoxin system death-on-curing family toxin [Candidatus Nitrosocosmicus sp.]|nr:type II toxin-antitoxin system death-on-curing family toxin [Candidatus Nitrosocosmicus sp.]
MIHYISIEEVLAIHEEMIRLFGGRLEVHDFTLLHSAVERPKASFDGKDLYTSIFDKATALIQSLILNHPFDDGNKRTALTSCAFFLSSNHFELSLQKDEAIQFTLDIDSHALSFEEISRWLKEHSERMN